MGPAVSLAGPGSGWRRLVAAACARAWHHLGSALLVPALLQAGALVAPPGARGQAAPELTEVFWEFKYGSLFDTIVNSKYDGEHFYLSLADVFGALQLNLVQDPAAGSATGFYVSTDRPYRLDFAAGRGEVDEAPVELLPEEYVADELGYYLRPESFDRLFALEITLDERRLSIGVASDDELPVVSAYRRRATRSRRTAFRPDAQDDHAELQFDRDRVWLGGGVLGYRLGLSMRGDAPGGSLNLRGGGELLGGDAEFSVTGALLAAGDGGSSLQTDLGSFRWRFVPGESPLLRQVRAGRLNSASLRPLQFDGLSLSNEPVKVERLFGSAPLRIETGPEWEVELYLNGQLIEARRADATGIALFQVPITYGTTQIRVMEFGPNGEASESVRRIQIPFTLVPRGDLRYTVDAGRESLGQRNLVQASAAVGLTRWMTLKAGVDYLGAGSDGDSVQQSAYGSLSARMGGPFILTATAAADGLFTVGLSAYHASLLNYNVEFRSYGTGGLYHPGRKGHETQASLTAPLRLRGAPIQLRANLTGRQTTGGRYDISLSPEISIQPGGAQMSLAYRARGTVLDGEYGTNSALLDARLGYSFRNTQQTSALLRGLLVTLRSSYDTHRSQLQSLTANLSRTMAGGTRAQVDLSHRPAGGLTTMGFRLQFNLPSARLSSGVQAGAGSPVALTQDVSGALSFDGGTRSFKMLRQDWVGRAAATVRLFVDGDGDGHYDRGETVIPNGGVRFRDAVSTQPGPGSTIIATNLLPYERYSLEVDQSRIRNPQWVPRFEEFSFVADPNRHKLLDIPFFVAGSVGGRVLRELDGGLTPVPGLKLHIRSPDGTETRQQAVFSDGSFAITDLPPGEYEAFVDSAQLAILKAAAQPAVRRFTLEPGEVGGMVDDVDFVLRPLATRREQPTAGHDAALAADAPPPPIPATASARGVTPPPAPPR